MAQCSKTVSTPSQWNETDGAAVIAHLTAQGKREVTVPVVIDKQKTLKMGRVAQAAKQPRQRGVGVKPASRVKHVSLAAKCKPNAQIPDPKRGDSLRIPRSK